MAKTTIDKAAAGAADDNTALTDYQALTTIKHDGVMYRPGETLALDEAEAEALRRVGAIGAVAKAAERKASASVDNTGEQAPE